MIIWPCHVIWLPKFPCCLYLDPIVWFEVLDRVFNCTGNYFHFGALITSFLIWLLWKCSIISLEQYNSLISGMLKQWYALTKLRAEIERRERRVCWECKRFRYLACNCRNRKEEIKGKLTPQNKFEVIASRVMWSKRRSKDKKKWDGRRG